jgi:hypothetical protein
MYAHALTALGAGEWSTAAPGRFTPGERNLGIHCLGSLIGLTVG